MRYKFKYTYTPDDVELDRRRYWVVINGHGQVFPEDVIRIGLKMLRMDGHLEDVIAEYNEAKAEAEDTDFLKCPVWVSHGNNGEFQWSMVESQVLKCPHCGEPIEPPIELAFD